MTEYSHEYVGKNNTGVFTSSSETWIDVDTNDGRISGLSANTKYLIVARAKIGGNDTTDKVGFRVQTDDDTGMEARSETWIEVQQTGITDLKSWLFARSFITDALPDTVDLQWKVEDAASQVRASNYTLFALDLDELGFEETNRTRGDWWAIYGGTGTNQEQGQSFKVRASHDLDRIVLWMDKVLTPTDNLKIEIATTAGGAAIGTSDNVAGADIATGGAEQVLFKFSTPVALTAGVQYYMRIIRDGSRSTSSFFWVYGEDATGDYPDGVRWYNDSGTWYIGTSDDLAFVISSGAWHEDEDNGSATEWDTAPTTTTWLVREVLGQEEWALLGYQSVDVGSTGVNYNVILEACDDATTSTAINLVDEEGEDTTEKRMVGLVGRHKANAAPTTSTDIRIRGWEDADNGNMYDNGSYIIALNVTDGVAFADFEYDYTHGVIYVNTEITVASVGPYTPSVNGNHLIVGRVHQLVAQDPMKLWLEDGITETRTGDISPTHAQTWDAAKDQEPAFTMQRISISAEKTYNLRATRPVQTWGAYDRWLLVLNLNKIAPDIEQKAFRFRDGTDAAGLNDDTNWGGTLNEDLVDFAVDDDPKLRLRMLLENDGNLGLDATTDYALYYRVNAGTWYAIGTGTGVDTAQSGQYADGDVTTQLIGSGTFNTGEGVEGSIIATDRALAIGSEIEHEWMVQFVAAELSDTDVIDFEVRHLLSGVWNSPDTTTQMPSITATKAAPLVPNADRTDGLWEHESGGNTDLYSHVDDESDSTYILDYSDPDFTTICALELSNPSETPGAGEFSIWVRADAQSISNDLTTTLWEGDTQRASQVFSNLATSPTTYEFVVTAAEAASITDWDNLNIRLRGQGLEGQDVTVYWIRADINPASASSPQSITVNEMSETESAKTVTPVSSQSVTVTASTETEAVQAVTLDLSTLVAASSETEAAQAVGIDLTVPVGTASEAETAVAVAVTTTVSMSVGVTSETETAVAVTVTMVTAVGVTSETETAVVVSPVAGPVSIGVTAAAEIEAAYSLHGHRSIIATSETESAQPVGSIQEQFVTVTAVAETEVAQAVSVTTTVSTSVTAASETEAAQNVQVNVTVSVGSASETESTTNVVYTSTTPVSVVVAAESETAKSIVITGAIDVGATTASETETAVVVVGRVAQTRSIAVPYELETAKPATVTTETTVGTASETETVQIASLGLGVQPAVESDTAMSIFGHRWVIATAETETAQAVTVVQQQFITATAAAEAELAEPVKIGRTVAVTTSSETEAGIAVGIDVTVQVNAASETETAQVVAPETGSLVTVTVTSETETAQAVTLDLTTLVTVTSEAEAAQSITAIQQQFISVTASAETETAQAVAINTATQVATATETEAARDAQPVRLLLPAQEVEAAQPVAVASSISVSVNTASETETAQAVTTEVSTAVTGTAETESTQAVAVVSPVSIQVATAAETETAVAVSPLTGTVTVASVASESETAQSVAIDVTAPIVAASETEAARALFGHRSILAAAETETANAIQVIQGQSIVVGTVSETEVSRPAGIGLSVGLITEAEAAEDVQVKVHIAVGQAAESESAESVGVTTVANISVGVVVEIASAGQVLADQAGAPQNIGVTASSETETTQTVAVYVSQSITVQAVGETETVSTVVPVNVTAVTASTETDTAEPVTVITVVTVPVGTASEAEAAQQAVTGRTVLVGVSGEVETVFAVPVLTETFVVITVAGEVESVVSVGYGIQLPGVAEIETATAVSSYITENYTLRRYVESRENKTNVSSRRNKAETETVGGFD